MTTDKKTLLEAARVALDEGEAAQVVERLLVLADRHSTPGQRRYEIRRTKDWEPKVRTIREFRLLFLSLDRELNAYGYGIQEVGPVGDTNRRAIWSVQ